MPAGLLQVPRDSHANPITSGFALTSLDSASQATGASPVTLFSSQGGLVMGAQSGDSPTIAEVGALTIVVGNNGTNQTITGLTVTLTGKTAGGLTGTVAYPLTADVAGNAVSIPNGQTQTFFVALSKGALPTVTLTPTFGAAPSAGTVETYTTVMNLAASSGGSGGSVSQGTAAAITAPWPVQLSDGTGEVGTPFKPIRTDPTGTTTQPVAGTVTGNQGTAAALSAAWPVKMTDGTNVLGTPTNPVTTIPATSVTNDVIFQNAAGASGNGSPFSVKGYRTLVVEVYGATSPAGTVTFQAAGTSGVFANITGTNLNGMAQATSTNAISATPVQWQFDVEALDQFQCPVTWTAGTITVRGRMQA